MGKKSVGIYIWKGFACLPSQARALAGYIVDREPVTKAKLKLEELAKALDSAIAADIPVIPDLSKVEFSENGKRILQAIGVSSWKELAKRGMYYSVEVSEADIKLSIPNALAEGGWAFDPAKTITFPSNVELNKVVQVILDDYATHSR